MSKQEEIKQALAAATPGPWTVYQSRVGENQTETLIGTEYDHPQLKSPMSIVGHAFSVGIEYTYIREEDAELISKAPEYIAYLLEYNERLSNGLERASQSHRYMEEELIKAQKELEEAVQAMSEPHKSLWFKLTNERNQYESLLTENLRLSKLLKNAVGQEGEGNSEQKA